MDEEQRTRLLDSFSRFPLPQGFVPSYGTAGFRGPGDRLASTVHRAAVVAALRSAAAGGAVVGLMITASHNPVADNGVKIADPDGGMMSTSWEPFANALANAADSLKALELMLQFMDQEKIQVKGYSHVQVLLGRDTRPTGAYLLEAAKQGINAFTGAVPIDMGILTTPQLHWMVRNTNKGLNASEDDYFTQLTHAFRCLVELVPRERTKDALSKKKIVVDGANGVGGLKLEEMKERVLDLEIDVKNSGKDGKGELNENCGADFVQKEKIAPCDFGPEFVTKRCASLDGDADRLVYFCLPSASSNAVELVDGDKILSLFAIFIKEQLDIINRRDTQTEKVTLPAKVGIVQTAYANGSSTEYLRKMGLEVVFTPTGVKHLHKKASEYDIGLYFEANGHGTILFSDKFLSQLESFMNDLPTQSAGSERDQAASRLLAVSQLINQAVGDALSGLLLVEAILQYNGWSFEDWCNLYHDLPSKQLKVKVADRNAILTTDAETKVSKPSGLQELIDKEKEKHNRGRCFVRPSGTEDVMRVYAEASTQEAAENLAKSVAEHVKGFLGT